VKPYRDGDRLMRWLVEEINQDEGVYALAAYRQPLRYALDSSQHQSLKELRHTHTFAIAPNYSTFAAENTSAGLQVLALCLFV